MGRIVFENEFIRQGILSGNEFRSPVRSRAMDIPTIVREVLKRTGMTQTEFAGEADVAQSTVSKWLADGHAPNTTNWDKALEWIMNDARTRDLVVPIPHHIIEVPIVSWVSAGMLADVDAQIPIDDETRRLPFANLGTGDFIALRVDGNSMDLVSPDGSVIVVNRSDKQLVSGGYYVFSHRGKAAYKIWRPGPPERFEPYSQDRSHEAIYVQRKKEFEVVGRVRRTVLDL